MKEIVLIHWRELANFTQFGYHMVNLGVKNCRVRNALLVTDVFSAMKLSQKRRKTLGEEEIQVHVLSQNLRT